VGLLAPAVAWLAHLEVSYILATLGCATVAIAAFHLVTVLALAGAAAGGVAARRCWRASRAEGDGRVARSRFMALFAGLASVAFGLAILAQAVPTLVLGRCQP
jgi:hypothetical protein